MEETAGHIGHPRIEGDIIEFHRIETLRQLKEYEKSPFGMRPADIFTVRIMRHGLLQHLQQDIPFSLVQGNAFGEVPVKTSVRNEPCRHILVEDWRTQVEGLLADIYLIQKIRMGEYPAEPEPRCHYLGKRAEMQCNVRCYGIY